MSITNIVLTGGPCAGKSTGLSRIEQELSQKGYKVFVVPKTATEIITGGIRPAEFDLFDFQRAIFENQSVKEKVYRAMAQKYFEKYHKNCIILYDRGLLDAKSFMPDKQYRELVHVCGRTETEVRDSYDGVFHLKTAADGAESFYTLGNNSARSETPSQARAVDKKCIRAWTGHPHLRVIDNSTDFEGKLFRLMREIYSLLGEPVPIEIERKYLIKMPDISVLENTFDVNKVNIIQTYLKSDDGIERRVRQRGLGNEFSYYYTEKTGDGISRVEKEKRISEKEYLCFLMDADTSLRQIRKDRYCFVYENNYIELDIYPFWDDYAIVEVELTNENESVKLPSCVEVVREVTFDNKFKNRSLASNVNIF